MTEKTITGIECRFAIHMPAPNFGDPDLHLIKEVVHYSDKTTEPRITFRRDYQRPYYVTKKSHRNHQQKKEAEHRDFLQEYWSNQSNLAFNVARSLGRNGSRPVLRQLSESPYLYGSDITSTTLIKYEYQKKYPNLFTPYRTAFFDIETDMVHGTEDPILTSIVLDKEIRSYYVKSFFDGYINVEEQLRACAEKYIGEYLKNGGYNLVFVECTDTIDMICKSFAQCHEWMPDFVGIWNIDFDIPRIIKTLEKYSVDPKDVFSDPRIPSHRRFAKYKKGLTKKVTSSGQVKPMNPSEQWHSLYCPASWYAIDAMSTYRFLRQGKQEEESYKLNFILDKVLGIRKLSFKEAEHLDADKWHTFMQERYKFEYTIYNIFDSLSVSEMNNKTKDLSSSFPIQVKTTDFAKFNSQTKRGQDALHIFLMENENMILATLPPVESAADKFGAQDMADNISDEGDGDEDDEFDEDDDSPEAQEHRMMSAGAEVLSLREWIVTLLPRLSMLGLRVIAEDPGLCTLIRFFVNDSDAVSAYPSCTAVANVSKATTRRELIGIIGIPEEVFRIQNLNLLHGHVNALEYCNRMLDMPNPQELLEIEDLMNVLLENQEV